MKKAALILAVLYIGCSKESEDCHLTQAECRAQDIHFTLTADCQCAIVEPPEFINNTP